MGGEVVSGALTPAVFSLCVVPGTALDQAWRLSLQSRSGPGQVGLQTTLVTAAVQARLAWQ